MGHCNFYKFALDKVKDAVILLQEHKIIYVNPSFEKLSSFRLEELTSSPSIYPFIIEEQQNEFQHCLDSETDIQTELLMTNNNQTQQTYQFQFNHMNKCCTCVLVTETSHRMQTMNALSWLRSLPLQHQEHYGLLEINDQTKNYVFQGKILQEMMNRDEASLSRCTEAATNILPHAPVRRINLTIKDRDIIGSLFFVSGKNSYRSVLMYMEDITMEKSCEFEITKLKKILAGKEEMLHYINQMFEFNMPVKMGLCTLSKEGDDICYILGNHGLAEMCGTTTEGIKGKTAIQLGEKPEDISGCLRAMKKAIATDEPVQYEIYIKSPSGVEKIYWACMVPVGNEICAFFGQEFTSHKQLEMKLEEDVRKRNEELRKALDVKSQFLATMSHEMRTPLSGIMIALQLLHEAQLTCEQEALLQTATVCGELLLAVINDVLDLSKLEENRVQLEEQPFCTRAVIEDSVEIVLMDIEQKNLEIVCDVDPDVPETVIGDANRIRQILVNLLSNAVKFSFEGEIQLKVSSLPSANGSGTCDISITVLDHGIGISPEAQKHLFQPFTQADSSMTRRFGGSGLGLSISKRLAELMHGKLTFTSEEGHGSSFTCRIRVKVPGTPPSPTRKNLFDRKIVFVVDPNLNRLRIVDRMLRSLSITTMCYTSLKEGLQHLETDKFRPDLALISNNEDVNLLIPLRQFVNTIIQTGITPKYPSVPLWKVPIRESTIVKQLSKYLISDQKQQQQRPGTTSPVENPVHLLLAEDNVMNQKLITRLLKSMGYPNVDIVDNGKQAVDAVKKSKYDIILMDCMMPEMTGMEATVKIRELDPTLQPKAIIALTANAFVENRDECLKCGMDDVVTKPISQCKLKESLVKYM